MEPAQAAHWANVASSFIRTGSLPVADKRKYYTDRADFGYLFRVDGKGNVNQEGPVQVIRLDSPIAKYDYCGAPGSQTLQQLIAAADADSTVSSILLWIDSPGGQADGVEALSNTIRSAKKPVIAYTDGMMASASYWIGSAAKEIIASGDNGGWNNTIGSIGTMVMFKDDSAKLEKEGVKVHTIFATESKDKWGDYREMQSGNYTKIIEVLDGYNTSFLNAVKQNRAGKLDLEAENVLTGKTYNAKKALKFGLIDRIGNFQQAVTRCMHYSKQQSLLNTNTMAFENTIKASGSEAFEVVEGGFLMTEDQLNGIEAHITQQANRIQELESSLQQFSDTAAAGTQAANDAAETIASLTQERDTLQARVTELEALPSSGMQNTVKEQTDTITGESQDEVSDVTKEANRLRALAGKPPVK